MSRIKKLLQENAGIPYTLFAVLEVIMHSRFILWLDDVVVKGEQLHATIWQEILAAPNEMHDTLSSRIFINPTFRILFHFDLKLWAALDILMGLLMMYMLSYFFVEKNNKVKGNWLVLLFMLLLPFRYAVDSGWVATTVTYLWTTTFALVAAVPVKKAIEGEMTHWYEWFLYIPCILWASDNEQVAVVFGFLFLIVIIDRIREKKVTPILYAELLIMIAQVIVHAGNNELRTRIETEVRYPDFGRLSLIDKLELGFSSTMYEYVFNFSGLFFVLTLVLAVMVWLNYKKWSYRVITSVPALASSVLGFGVSEVLEGRLHTAVFANRLLNSGTITEGNYYRWQSYYAIVILFVVSICLVVSIYLAFGNTKACGLAMTLMVAGLGSRVAMGLSPTVWFSGRRTFLLMYFCMMGVLFLLWRKVEDRLSPKQKKILVGVIVCVAIVVYAFQFLMLDRVRRGLPFG